MSMKRSELYEKVWSVPVTRLAKELGISDVGLAKVCRRHAIPIPPRGYWAKLKVGSRPSRTPLPAPELDVVVHFAMSDPEERERQRAIAEHRAEVLRTQAASMAELPVIALVENLDGAHPLVKATQKYCERIPKLVARANRNPLGGWSVEERDRPPPEQHGRYNLIHRGCLDINASLESMSWVLVFHATVLRALTEGAMKIVRKEEVVDRSSGRTSGPVIEMHLEDEVLKFGFSEGYRRIRLSPSELAAKKKVEPWAGEHEYKPSGLFTFTIQGTESRVCKTWQGTREKLQSLVSEVVHTAFHLAAVQPQYRKEREEREAKARRDEELRLQERHWREARAEQLKQAFLMMEADARVRQLKEFLERTEQGVSVFRPPFDERMKVWIGVVREELEARNPANEIIHKCLTVPSWATWPPAWWPTGEASES
jgi:hypothetical protein